jgi:hypothetical protein
LSQYQLSLSFNISNALPTDCCFYYYLPIKYCTNSIDSIDSIDHHFYCSSCHQPPHQLTSAYLLDKLDGTPMSNYIDQKLQTTLAYSSINSYGTTFTIREVYHDTKEDDMIDALRRLYPVSLYLINLVVSLVCITCMYHFVTLLSYFNIFSIFRIINPISYQGKRRVYYSYRKHHHKTSSLVSSCLWRNTATPIAVYYT